MTCKSDGDFKETKDSINKPCISCTIMNIVYVYFRGWSTTDAISQYLWITHVGFVTNSSSTSAARSFFLAFGLPYFIAVSVVLTNNIRPNIQAHSDLTKINHHNRLASLPGLHCITIQRSMTL